MFSQCVECNLSIDASIAGPIHAGSRNIGINTPLVNRIRNDFGTAQLCNTRRKIERVKTLNIMRHTGANFFGSDDKIHRTGERIDRGRSRGPDHRSYILGIYISVRNGGNARR